ncbi:MAG TPA: LytR C-terminal domain-containing protein [Gaiellales bacterium]|nr:LytR C-terminal domain-containing protein [Gaiellales bacterium]
MARVETRSRPIEAEENTGEEHLDDWFARRLQSQGIPSRLGAPSTARILAVAGLAVALLAFLWALSSVGSSHSTSSVTTPPATTSPNNAANNAGGGGGGNGSAKHGTVAWNTVNVDVLNGFGGSGAAASNAAVLRAAGWTVGTTGNASGITKTEVVYLPGHDAQAKAVAKKLGLGQPVPIAQATGVPSDATSGVAIVLGPDQLTNTTVH